MLKSLISSIALLVALALIIILQACTAYHANDDLDKSRIYRKDTGYYGGAYSGKGPGGMGVK
jgi:hypothetical protein